jgi:hypothetical protein
LPVVIAHNKAGVQFFDRPERREAAALHDRILLRRKPYGHGSGARTIPSATDRENKHLGVLIELKPRITQKPSAPEKAARLSCIPIWPGIGKWVGLPHLPKGPGL